LSELAVLTLWSAAGERLLAALLADLLAAAHAELSYQVPQKVVLNVACAAGTFACGCHKILACARCICVQAAAWANFAADWLQICVGMPAVGDSLGVGAFACGA